MKKKSRIIEEMYESMRDLHAAGVVGDHEMDEAASIHDSYKAPQYSADMIKNLRRKLNLTQVSLASMLNTFTQQPAPDGLASPPVMPRHSL